MDSYNFFHHELVRSIYALTAGNFHRFQCHLLSTQLCVSQQRPGRALCIESTAADSDHVFDFQYVSCAIELDYEVFIYDDECGFKVTHLFARPPLLCVADAALEGLIGILGHHLFESFNKVEGISKRPCKATVHTVPHFADLFGVYFDFGAAKGDLTIANDNSLSMSFEGEYGGVMPFLSGEAPSQQLQKHLNYNITLNNPFHTNHMIIPINKSLAGSSLPKGAPAPERQVINGRGVHDATQLILVGLLIMASVSAVVTINRDIHQHDRYLRTYFNLHLLGKNDLGYYEEGLNIDECEMEFVTLEQMKEHFRKILNVSRSMEEDGLVAFEGREKAIIKFEMHSQRNQFNSSSFDSVDQALAYFHNLETDFFRDLLLSSYQLRLSIHLGSNKFVEDYELIAEYTLYSEMMIKTRLDADFRLRNKRGIHLNGLRVLQQIIASVLFALYLYQLLLLSKKSQKHRIFLGEVKNTGKLVKKFQYWYFFLLVMCLLVMLSPKYAPFCAFMQLLPVFEFPDRQEQGEDQMYNFNKNLRFSFPLILTIFMQIFIFLNGFIFYSMLMYPGAYFDDYLKGFFSYVYQLFQVGTYEIFTELQSYGNFAYLLYALLYFYVFEVGNSLIPALFVIMIEMKVTEKFLKRHIAELVQDCACPNCGEKNGHEIGTDVHVVVMSPRLAPLLNRKKYKKQAVEEKEEREQGEGLMLFIEEESSESTTTRRFHQNIKFTNMSSRILHISRRLQQQINKGRGQEWLQQSSNKVEAFLTRLQ